DHIAVIGPNGIGKSTFIKTIAQKETAIDGEIIPGANLRVGYYDQKQAEFTSNKTILDFVWDQYPDMNEKDIRAVLGRFLFVQDEVKKVITDLSGGEKARLQLALLMLERNNVFILDEPTNHLDIDSKEMLEQALSDFDGTLIFVSHDRYFINQLANKVFEMDAEGGVLYLGDYQYYIEKKEEQAALTAKAQASEAENEKIHTTETNYAQQKQQKREQRQIERQIEQCEQEISEYEERIAELKEAMTQPDVFSDPEKANELATEKFNTEQQLERVMTQWEELQESLS
ncbi:ABC transporter ATP-binding protein, partial [Staphylococcus auricularis]